jgi:hypothetical protein
MRYQDEVFRNPLVADVRIRAAYVDYHGSSRLFYNNDVESTNHVLKNAINREVRSLSDVIDLLPKQIISQRSKSGRALYDSGELEIVHPYIR